MAKVVILGAGLTGLSAAYHLEKEGFFDYALFEQEQQVGGLCRSVNQDGFTFDFTGHLLHTSDPYFKNLITQLVGIEYFNSIVRRSFIYSHQTYTRYPFQINLYGLPPSVIAECIEGYVNRTSSRKKPRTFVQWVRQNFGSGFARHFFLPFQRKIFAHNLHAITASWTGRFVPKTSLQQMLLGAFDNSDQEVGYNAHFYYPKQGGIQFWIDRLAQHIIKPIHTHYSAQSIDLQKRIITFKNGHKEQFTYLINTIPLDTLIGMLQEAPTSSLNHAQKHLLCNQVINFNLGIARENLTDKHWIYFPEKQFPFYRIGFPHNFAHSMAPAGHSSLYGECSFIKATGNTKQQLLRTALEKTYQLFKLAPHEIITEKIIHINHAYVIYNQWRERNLAKIFNRLQQYSVFSTGRYGAWKYASMQEAILDGKQVADSILAQSKPNLIIKQLGHTNRKQEVAS